MTEHSDNLTLAAEITAAWLSNPSTRANAEDVPNFLRSIHAAVSGLSAPAATETAEEAPAAEYTPAVTARKSLSNPDFIISMIDGKPYKTLRRHLATNGLTPDEYRRRYGLKAGYPMVAAAYSESRRAMAKQIGLGRKSTKAVPAEPAASKPKRGGRKSAADANAAAD
jgi:predicted transcriptional regulator